MFVMRSAPKTAALLAVIVSQALIQYPQRPLSVCEVLQDLNRYDGKFIEVRGEFGGNHIRGPGYDVSQGFMIPELVDDREACDPVVTGEYTWFSALAFGFPGNADVEAQLPTQWSYHRDAYQRAVDEWLALLDEGEAVTVEATVVGRLDLKPWGLQVDPVGRDAPDGGFMAAYMGFGDNGVFPARLILVSIHDIRVAEEEQ